MPKPTNIATYACMYLHIKICLICTRKHNSFIHAFAACEDCVVLLKMLFAHHLHPYVLFVNVSSSNGVVPVHCSIFFLAHKFVGSPKRDHKP